MALPVRIATRGSALARTQAETVARSLPLEAELVIVSTAGDRNQQVPLHAIGGTGVFVKEVEEALLRGDADIAVHSAKDLSTGLAPGLVIGAVPPRADPRDALVGSTFDRLPAGARVGTGSVRRRAQLAGLRPDLVFGELRGNIGTRLSRLDRFDAVVVAAAALQRLGRLDEAAELLDPSVLLPQVAQGALAVECGADRTDVLDLLAGIDDRASHRAVDAERAFLESIGSGCNLPVGALATPAPASTPPSGSGDPTAPGVAGRAAGALRLEGLIASLDGRVVLRTAAEGSDPEALGREVARRLLHDHGGADLLDAVA